MDTLLSANDRDDHIMEMDTSVAVTRPGLPPRVCLATTPERARDAHPPLWSRHDPLSAANGPQGCRIVLYSHDTMGLGHMRRNLLIAETLARAPIGATILMIAGARRASAFALPSGVDCLCLPALHKGVDGRYTSRRLDVSLQNLISLRSSTIRAALEAFEPDVLIVDNVPRGAQSELDASLKYLRARGRTRCVLGLRDVLDDPETVQREWGRAANEATLRDYYDAVWVYGDRAVYDPVSEYRFSPEVAAKLRYTGYFDQRMRLDYAEAGDTDPLPALQLPPGRLMLCLVGGGQDGAELAEAFAQADLPCGANGVILAGPSMPRKAQLELRRYAAINPRLRVLDFVSEPIQFLKQADRVVAMGGYNTVNELLSFDRQALIVPRATPRREQLIRAERLRDLGLFDILHPNDVSPRALTEWLARDLRPPPRTREHIDLNGLAQLPRLLGEVFATLPGAEPLYAGA